jgi:PPM family protein phosphatase
VAAAECPACGAGVEPDDVYCEACGHELATPVPAGTTAAAAQWWVSSAATALVCPGCGGDVFGVEGYCEGCGQRRLLADQHSELELGDDLAAVSDRGLRNARNEDAVGLARLGGRTIAVVCDGVGSSTRPDAASHAAVDACLPALLAALDRGEPVGEAIGAATRAAQAAVALVAGEQPPANPPSSTFVLAVGEREVVTVGWVGDSRAYWVPAEGDAELLTVDDAVPGRFADGSDAPEHAGALTRWLGSDARDTDPHLRTLTPTGPGRLLVVSDGLYRYYPEPADVAALLTDAPPLALAQQLVRHALDAGGADNVSVAVLPWPPAAPAPAAAPKQEQ